MLTQVEIIKVEERMHKEKRVADVIFMTDEPSNVHKTTLWNNVVIRGEHEQFKKFVGKKCFIALRPEIFNNQIQFNIQTNFAPLSTETVQPAKG